MDSVKLLSKQLRNVGPKLAEKMVLAGIESPEHLRRIGSIEAFRMMYPEGDAYGDFNAAYLYALEGAIRDCDWLDVPETDKSAFKSIAKELQEQRK